MTEITDLSPTDSSNTSVSGESLDGAIANMGRMDNTLQAILGMFGRWTSSDTIASSGTTDIGAQSEAYLNVSGTTTITSFGTVRTGTIRFLTFAGILTLTHNATSLILPSGASIITAAGDVAVMVSEGSGNWRCLSYQRASGQAIVTPDSGRVRAATTANIVIATALNSGDVIDGVTLADNDLVLVKNQTTSSENGVYVVGATPARSSGFNTWASFLAVPITVAEGTSNAVTSWISATPKAGTLGSTAITFRATSEVWEPISKISFSNVATQSFVDLSPYVMWRLTGYIIPLTNAVTIRLRVSSNNGSSYASGAGDYTFQYDRGTGGTADAGSGTVDSGLIAPFTVGNSTGYLATINVSSYAFNKAQAGYVVATGGGIDGVGGRGVGDVLSTVNLTTARDAFQVFASSGNITGFLMLEGVRG